jgi:hypothetical protein
MAQAASSVAAENLPQAGLASGSSRALLIGVNDYLAVPDLRGALNDVEFLREILISRFGFEADDIEVLLDRDATRKGVLAAFDRLAARTQEGDLVYVHYSGHGSQVKDLDGDEEDGQDETLIPHDGRTPGVPDITDDEIGDKLDALRAKTTVVVLDSCHSGTATRSMGALSDATALRGGMTPRYVPSDTRTELYSTLRRESAVGTRAVVPLVQSGHVLLTGAAFNEEALDGPVDRRSHGLFSYAFGKSLSRSAPTASAREVFAGVEEEFERIRGQLGLNKMPDPQLEAESADLSRPLFARPSESAAPTRLAWIDVAPEGKGKVRLVRGGALGAGRGSLWAVYPPGETRFLPGQALAEAEVTSLSGSDAIATLAPKDMAIPKGARAVALAPPPASADVPIALVDGNASRAKALRQAVEAQLPGVRFVDPGEFARFVVRFDGGRAQVTGADGLFGIADLDASDVAALARDLANLFARSLTASELLALDNPAAALDIQLAVVARAEAELEPSDERGMVLVSSSDSPEFRVRREGERRNRNNSLQLRVQTNTDCTLTVVDVDSEGGVQVLFPNPISEKKGYYPGGTLKASEEFLLPDSLAQGNRAGFHIDYAPPAGTDTVRAFCTRDPRAAQALRETVRTLDPNATRTRSGGSSGLGSLRKQLAGLASRGLKLVEDTGEPLPDPLPPPSAIEEEPPPAPDAWYADWAAASVTIDVKE